MPRSRQTKRVGRSPHLHVQAEVQLAVPQLAGEGEAVVLAAHCGEQGCSNRRRREVLSPIRCFHPCTACTSWPTATCISVQPQSDTSAQQAQPNATRARTCARLARRRLVVAARQRGRAAAAQRQLLMRLKEGQAGAGGRQSTKKSQGVLGSSTNCLTQQQPLSSWLQRKLPMQHCLAVPMRLPGAPGCSAAPRRSCSL